VLQNSVLNVTLIHQRQLQPRTNSNADKCYVGTSLLSIMICLGSSLSSVLFDLPFDENAYVFDVDD